MIASAAPQDKQCFEAFKVGCQGAGCTLGGSMIY